MNSTKKDSYKKVEGACGATVHILEETSGLRSVTICRVCVKLVTQLEERTEDPEHCPNCGAEVVSFWGRYIYGFQEESIE